MHDRFFDSTRGKIVGALRSRGAASAFDLAAEFALSPNAIRQQLVILERDGLVVGKSVRRGKTKPTHEYSLTSQADRYFPQASHQPKVANSSASSLEAVLSNSILLSQSRMYRACSSGDRDAPSWIRFQPMSPTAWARSWTLAELKNWTSNSSSSSMMP